MMRMVGTETSLRTPSMDPSSFVSVVTENSPIAMSLSSVSLFKVRSRSHWRTASLTWMYTGEESQTVPTEVFHAEGLQQRD